MIDANVRLYRHAGGAMLRAAVLPLSQQPGEWPTLSDPDSCRSWLRAVWALPGFADAIRYASGSFAAQVEAVLDGQPAGGRQVRRVTSAVVRYLLRSMGRPTPFGLFAGVAGVQVGEDVRVRWGVGHRLVLRADTLWLDDVAERLEALPDLLTHLDVVACDLLVERGDRIEMPRGPGRVTVRNTSVMRLVRGLAAKPIPFHVLLDQVAMAFPAVPFSAVRQTLGDLVTQGILITSLRAPMTVTDPLEHMVATVERAVAGGVEAAGTTLSELRAIQRVIRAHNAEDAASRARPRLRDEASARMRRLSPAGRTPLAGDLHLDCDVAVSVDLAGEMAYAVGALLRLTRQPRPDQGWNDWCREFWDRYGTGALVPVRDAVHPDTGIGWPAGFPGTMLAEPEVTVSRRDEELLRLAWDAVTAGQRELVLTDELIAVITADTPVDPRWIPPHVELGARVHASTVQALAAGDYTFSVHPAWAFGTLTCRFGSAVSRAGLDSVFAAAPTAVEGALPVQLSFPPLFPHSENVSRVPRWLPHVLPVGEHRTDDATAIRLDDLGIVAVADGLHLVSISRRQLVEPQVFHALALRKQAPPLARFLATLTRGFLARFTEFDWGPLAARLPYMPRVRYRRAILSPATWRISAADHTALHAGAHCWEQAFARWRQRWACPDTVELHDDHRSLRLDLTVDAHLAILREHLDKHGHATLTEADTAEGTRWIGGHVHEIVMPFVRAVPAAPNLVTGALPLVTNANVAHRPASPHSSWLYAQIFTHPERLDDILRTHLPQLLALFDGDRPYWFARYRSVRETDHLRLRIRAAGPEEYAAVACAVGQWGQQLCDAGVASRLSLATYHPEVGRYGNGAAMDAAEAVFAADSHVVALQLATPLAVHPMALTAIGMVEIADSFHPDPVRANGWLLEHLAAKTASSADRTVTEQVTRWATRGTLPGDTSLPDVLVQAWEARREALTRYRLALAGDTDADQVLSALLHMHHNRARLADRVDEATCRRLARQIALTRRAHTTAHSA
ncbi:lantibiotic dehydratase [Frankia sp. CNm7]|uniref:Lantibiotic dehydratase n=1 Tax=Frankia nepalensis TaxID=1836974 RepID=A0A937RE13_9ACTN|nr:lantibiotic dehydratase [Frankia nepalensis]MBL7502014.1 lantibiotic dehydratase [Frankia nepalensis]MBL7510310.1 lantibiotic dehydratase [Frankia nepalensis]MBL7517020.1 lantibiotic dehydratase [Frankia nepalensis]MBL7630441.1 lantibiotic dehydratase [Frankia nepalensis]